MKVRTGFVSNSSSSSFICDYKHKWDHEPQEETYTRTLESVKEQMERIRNAYNTIYKDNPNFMNSKEVLKRLEEYPNDDYYHCWNFKESDYKVFVADEEYEKDMIESWGPRVWDEKINEAEPGQLEATDKIAGHVIIESNGDNMIPYTLFNFIETLFRAHRVHMG